MKSRTVRLGRSIVLSIIFVITFFSLLGGHGGRNPALASVHAIAGSLLLVGAGVHLGTNMDWIKAVYRRRASDLQGRLRSLRRTDTWLFISATLCAVAGMWWLIFPVHWTYELHTLSGLVMVVFLTVHLVQHWGWLVNTIHSMRKGTSTRPLQAHSRGEIEHDLTEI
jgi:hypothetical protein